MMAAVMGQARLVPPNVNSPAELPDALVPRYTRAPVFGSARAATSGTPRAPDPHAPFVKPLWYDGIGSLALQPPPLPLHADSIFRFEVAVSIKCVPPTQVT